MVQTNLLPVAPIEDNGFGIFEMEGGRTATVQASWTEWAGYMYMEVYGADGFIRIDNRGTTCMTVLGRREGGVTVFDYSEDKISSYAREWDDYARALLDGRQPLPSGRDGLRAVEMAAAVYESARAGKRVRL